jgi:hypothetical protein
MLALPSPPSCQIATHDLKPLPKLLVRAGTAAEVGSATEYETVRLEWLERAVGVDASYCSSALPITQIRNPRRRARGSRAWLWPEALGVALG